MAEFPTPSIEWVPIASMHVSDEAQRKYRSNHKVLVKAASGDFDITAIGYPVINYRPRQTGVTDGGIDAEVHPFIVDGQHRIEGLKMIGWGDQQIQCEVYRGLTLAQEAELFLMRDDRRAISSLEKFKIGVTAGREEDSAIDALVRSLGLQVAYYPGQKGAIHATGVLRKVRDRAGDKVLAFSLSIIRDAFGEPGLTATMIDGVALVCQRYYDKLDGNRLVSKLAATHAGVNGVLNRANVLQRQTGNQMSHCVAATIVAQYNGGAGGVKGGRLTDWWRPDRVA